MTDLIRYTPSRDADLLITQLWVQADADGDLERIFSAPNYPLSAFLRVLAAPNETFYTFDEAGIWFLVWFEPFAHGAFVSAYFRKDKRSCVSSATLFLRILRAQAQVYRALIALTSQYEVTRLTTAMGFTTIGVIPALLNGKDAYLATLTAESQAVALASDTATDAIEAHRTATIAKRHAVWREARNG